MRKRFIRVTAIVFVLLLVGNVVLAQTWEFIFPTNAVDSSGSARDSVGVMLEYGGTALVNSGKIDADGLDTRMMVSGSEIPYMMSTGDVTAVTTPLPASGRVTFDLYTGYSVDLTSFDIVPGDGGYVTMTDDATLELGNDFALTLDGTYFPTDTSTTVVSKDGAIEVGTDGSGSIYASIPILDPIDLTPPSGYAAWVTMDLSAYIPSDATGVVLEVDAATKDCGFRMNGSADARIPDTFHNWVMVGVDANGVIEVYIEDATVGLYLVAYTDDNWVYNLNADDVSLGGINVWTDIDVTAITSTDCIGVIVEIVNTAGANSVNVRNDGSADARLRGTQANSHYWTVVGVDAATEIFEGRIADLSIDFYLIGWCEGGATFKVNADDKSLVGAAVWTDIDCSVEAPAGTFLFWEINDGGLNEDYGFRQDGSTDSILGIETRSKGGAFVPCNSVQVVEGRISNVTVDFFLMGYATDGIFTPTGGVSSAQVAGEYDVELELTGGTLGLTIDTVLEDSTAFAGSVIDNANDWILGDGISYIGSYEHEVSGVTHAWYQPNYMVTSTDVEGDETAGGSTVLWTAAEITEGVDYWVGARVTVLSAGAAAPEGESRVCTASAVGSITVAPAFSANIDIGDTVRASFGTLIDRSYYGLNFDGADDNVNAAANAVLDITDKATLAAWVYIDSDGENNEGSIIDRRDAGPDGYRLYVSNEAAGLVSIEAILDCAVQDAYAVTNVDVAISGWRRVVAVYDRLGTDRWEIYVDGSLETLSTDNDGQGAIAAHTANVPYVGDNLASNRCFDGRIDEVSFYQRAWDSTEATADYNAGAGLYTPADTTSLQWQLHMEEGSGAATADTSGNALNGTIVNATWLNGQVPRPAGNAGTNDAFITWGTNTNITITYGIMSGSGSSAATSAETGGFTMPTSGLPATWFAEGGNMANLPFYDSFLDVSNQTGQPVQTIYFLAIIGFAFGVWFVIGVNTRSALLAILGLNIVLFVGSSMTIIPMWLPFVLLVVQIGILYLYRQVAQ